MGQQLINRHSKGQYAKGCASVYNFPTLMAKKSKLSNSASISLGYPFPEVRITSIRCTLTGYCVGSIRVGSRWEKLQP